MIATTYTGTTKGMFQPLIFIYEEGHHPRHALLCPQQQDLNQTIQDVTIEYERHGEVPTKQFVSGPTPMESAALEAIMKAEREALAWKTKIVQIKVPTVMFMNEHDVAALAGGKYSVTI